ncbi:chromosomal replication initiator protein DnaA [Patescibacteria group bacterium]|nr:MAG: chromosomal replication initiator protein DnaA [Patescibacteria group bacterium]
MTQDKEKLWQAVLGELEVTLSKANFTTWFKDTFIVADKDEKLTIGVPNAFTREWLKNKYHSQIIEAFKNITKQNTRDVIYEVANLKDFQKTDKPSGKTTKKVTSKLQGKISPELTTQTSSRDFGLNPRYTFENFVVGNNNRLAHAACLAVSKTPGEIYNPLFIYGGVGLGKTHLLQAIGNQIKKTNLNKKVVYTTSEKFMNEMISAIRGRSMNKFKDRYRKVDVLIIDDIQFLAGKESTQEEFFHTFNSLYEANKQIIVSSDRPPKAIPTLENRLRSRFEGGMIADIQPPDFEMRVAILKEKAHEKEFSVPKEVIEYIAKSIQQNIRELEGALTRIMAYCELNNSKPTIESTANILGNILTNPKRRHITAKQIANTIASFYNIKMSDLTGHSRKREVTYPRQVAMYLMREEIRLSYPRIGEELGGRDHTTVIHAWDKINKNITENENLNHEVNLIKERLYMP